MGLETMVLKPMPCKVVACTFCPSREMPCASSLLYSNLKRHQMLVWHGNHPNYEFKVWRCQIIQRGNELAGPHCALLQIGTPPTTIGEAFPIGKKADLSCQTWSGLTCVPNSSASWTSPPPTTTFYSIKKKGDYMLLLSRAIRTLLSWLRDVKKYEQTRMVVMKACEVGGGHLEPSFGHPCSQEQGGFGGALGVTPFKN